VWCVLGDLEEEWLVVGELVDVFYCVFVDDVGEVLVFVDFFVLVVVYC